MLTDFCMILCCDGEKHSYLQNKLKKLNLNESFADIFDCFCYFFVLFNAWVMMFQMKK